MTPIQGQGNRRLAAPHATGAPAPDCGHNPVLRSLAAVILQPQRYNSPSVAPHNSASRLMCDGFKSGSLALVVEDWACGDSLGSLESR